MALANNPDYYVYLLINPTCHQIFYVGKGSGTRYQDHLREKMSNTRNPRKCRVILACKRANLTIPVHFYEENGKNRFTEQEAYDIEERLIRQMGRKGYEKGGVLTNLRRSSRPKSLF